jgi:hypothetical protein
MTNDDRPTPEQHRLSDGTDDRVWIDEIGDAYTSPVPNATPYRLDSPDDPLVRMSEVVAVMNDVFVDLHEEDVGSLINAIRRRRSGAEGEGA